MDNLQILVLAVVQGLTEFLPISSSAHLVLMPYLFGWADQGLVFDVAVHFGSLLAVLAYFRVEVRRMLAAWLRSLGGGGADRDGRLAWWIIVASLPVMVAGLLLRGAVEDMLRAPGVIALASIGFGLLLWFADSRTRGERDEYGLRLRDALLVGCCQALALIPGTSRSGITITAGLLLGLTRQAAARFSFLLSMPVIFASGMLQLARLVSEPVAIDWRDLALGIGLSALAAGLCIHFFLRLVDRVGMLPFVIYRVLLGVAIFALVGW